MPSKFEDYLKNNANNWMTLQISLRYLTPFYLNIASVRHGIVDYKGALSSANHNEQVCSSILSCKEKKSMKIRFLFEY